MPGDRPSIYQEAAGRTTEDLIERVEYTNRTCNDIGCEQCESIRAVLTARIYSPTSLAANSIGWYQHQRAQHALEGATNGTTTTTVDSDEERYPRLYEATPPDIGAAVPSSEGPQDIEIRPVTGGQFPVDTPLRKLLNDSELSENGSKSETSEPPAPTSKSSSQTNSSPTSQQGPTLGVTSPLPLSEQLRVLTIQFSLQELSHVNVRTALEHQLTLLEPDRLFRLVLDEMIEEQRPRPDSPELAWNEYDLG